MRLVVFLLVLSPLVAHAGPKRAAPDYDGRPDEDETAWLWVPRVLLSPLYLLSEYGVRRPLGAIVTNVERVQLPQPSAGASLLGEVDTAVAPSFFVDYAGSVETRISAGLYLFAGGLFGDDHSLHARLTYGNNDQLELDVDNRLALDAHTLSLALDFHARDDALLGRDRYGVAIFGVTLGERFDFATGHFAAGVELRHTLYAKVPALERRQVQLVPTLRFAHDDVLRVDLQVATPLALAGDAAHTLEASAELGLVYDIYRRRRVGARVFASLAEPLDEGPLTPRERSRLGGRRPMRAFMEGELVGESALVAILDYRWPVWVWLDGQVFVECGNAFGEHLHGLGTDALRLSFGLGFRSPEIEPQSFEVLFAAGTDTASDGLTLSHVRIVFGTSSGF